jgi:carbon-monoxide dehydrogenase medium subunit
VSFKFIQPESFPEVVETLSQYGDEAKIIAGGTAVVLMLQQKLIAPQVLVSLSRVPGLDYIRAEADGLHVGPLTLLRDVALSPTVQQQVPALAQACAEVGNVRIQNQATLGGNLAEADYASDPPAMLAALDAAVRISGPAGSRTVPVVDFLLGFYTTILEPDEVVSEVFVPSLPGNSRTTYLKYKSRSSEDRPCVGVAAVASFADELCTDLRVAVGAACEVPVRLPEFEALAQGQPLSDALINDIAAGYAANVETLEDLRGSAWYRTQMVQVHVQRALKEVRNGDR